MPKIGRIDGSFNLYMFENGCYMIYNSFMDEIGWRDMVKWNVWIYVGLL